MSQPRGFRQTNAWLHTWIGLLPGWLLYAVFLTGTISFFHEELTVWMKPELHHSVAQPDTAARALAAMSERAPDAALWQIQLPSERSPVVQVRWYAPGEPMGRGSGQSLTLDAATMEPLTARDTRGGHLLYRFHFELYGLPRIEARWAVALATMAMFIALITGVFTHKKIFKDFFTFRPRKGQRSWLDAHNALAVLALPFHLMITFSGLLLFMFLLMPWGMDLAYDGDRRAFFNDTRSGRMMAPPPAASDAAPAQLAALAPMLAAAEAQWPRGVDSIQVSQPLRSDARITLREHGAASLRDRGNSRQLQFDGVSGEPVPMDGPPMPSITSQIYNVFTSLHLIRFGDTTLRWLMFISGVLGTLMIATGMVLWVVKRLPQRRKQGRTPLGHHLVESLNIATLVGLPLAIGVYLWANRLLPAGLAGRGDWEINALFGAWALCLLHPLLLRNYRRAWLQQLLLCGVLLLTAPLAGVIGGGHLFSHLGDRHGLLLATDLTLMVCGLAFLLAAHLYRRRSA